MGRTLQRLQGGAGTGRTAARLQSAAADASEPRSVGGFFGNVASSGGNFLKSIFDTVTNPVQTVKGLGSLGLGALEKLVPGEQEHEKYADTLGEHFKERYGGLENVGKTLYQDPVGFLADLSTVAGGAGALLKGAGTVSKVGSLGRGGEIATKVSGVTDPLLLPRNVAATAAKSALVAPRVENTAVRLFGSSLKPSKSVQKAHPKVDVVRAGLEEGVTVSPRGLEKVQGRIEDVNTRITESIGGAKDRGVLVDPRTVVKRTKGLKERFSEQVSPQEDLSAIDRKIQDFLTHPQHSRPSKTNPDARVPTRIPVDEAQKLKSGTYRELRGKYGQERTAGIETEKALARGIKEEIARQVPEIGELNARDTRLIALEDALEDAVRRTGNRDVLGLKSTIALAANPKVLLATVMDHPGVKSALAQILYKTSKGNLPSLRIGGQNPYLQAVLNVASPLRYPTRKAVLTGSLSEANQ